MDALFSIGANEAGDAEVAEDQGHTKEDEEMHAGVGVCGGGMKVGAMGPDGACCKESKDAEEGTGDFQPEDTGELGEWSPDGLTEALAATGDAFACLAGLYGGAGGGSGCGCDRACRR